MAQLLALVLALFDRCVVKLVAQFMATRESIIRSQAQSLLDMSTTGITLWESILLLPLVGIVDSVRAVQVAERLLEAIGRTEAEMTVIDVTGVPVMDTSVARHLLRTVAAAEMLVEMGRNLVEVPTAFNLERALARLQPLMDAADRSGFPAEAPDDDAHD